MHPQPPTLRTLRRIREIHQALTALSSRTLPSIAADLKVSARLRELRPLVEDSDALIRRIRAQTPVPDGLTGSEIPMALVEARQRDIDAMLETTVEMEPLADARRITADDLPKALKSASGEENRAGLADIILNLDDYYAQTDDAS
jgi:hypothetical protein